MDQRFARDDLARMCIEIGQDAEFLPTELQHGAIGKRNFQPNRSHRCAAKFEGLVGDLHVLGDVEVGLGIRPAQYGANSRHEFRRS
jgi:hypothetical protein